MHFTYTAKCTPSSVSVIVIDHERNIKKKTDLLALPPPFKAAKIPECIKCPNKDNRMFGDQSAAETMYKNTSLRDCAVQDGCAALSSGWLCSWKSDSAYLEALFDSCIQRR